jgi:hypothetical protein
VDVQLDKGFRVIFLAVRYLIDIRVATIFTLNTTSNIIHKSKGSENAKLPKETIWR